MPPGAPPPPGTGHHGIAVGAAGARPLHRRLGRVDDRDLVLVAQALPIVRNLSATTRYDPSASNEVDVIVLAAHDARPSRRRVTAQSSTICMRVDLVRHRDSLIGLHTFILVFGILKNAGGVELSRREVDADERRRVGLLEMLAIDAARAAALPPSPCRPAADRRSSGRSRRDRRGGPLHRAPGLPSRLIRAASRPANAAPTATRAILPDWDR